MPEELPYIRIAADLRRRIRAGELKPGDRVPSTRALARRWRVALATAAHALRTLADEGLVRTVPRTGTVVAPRRARGGERALTRESIVEAAIEIADREGLSALSIRGVAAKLGVPVMTLHHRIRGKDELLRLAIDAVMSEAKLPATPPRGWRAQLEVSARAQWQAFKRHPWLARVMMISRPRALPSAAAHADWVLGALAPSGLDAAERMRIHVVLHGYIQGIAGNLEAESEAAGETGLTEDDWMRSQYAEFEALAATGRYPAFAAALRELDDDFELEFDDLFERGLRALLDGFAPIVERRRARR